MSDVEKEKAEKKHENYQSERSEFGARLTLIYDSTPDPKTLPSGYSLFQCQFDALSRRYFVELVRKKGDFNQVSPDWTTPKVIMRRMFVITESFRDGGYRHCEHISCAYFDSDGHRISPEQAQVIADSLIPEPASKAAYAERWIWDEKDAHRNGGDPLRVTEGRIIQNGQSPIESDPFLAIIAKSLNQATI